MCLWAREGREIGVASCNNLISLTKNTESTKGSSTANLEKEVYDEALT